MTVCGMECEGTMYSPDSLESALVPERKDSASRKYAVCFVVGIMAPGHVAVEDYLYIENMISVF